MENDVHYENQLFLLHGRHQGLFKLLKKPHFERGFHFLLCFTHKVQLFRISKQKVLKKALLYDDIILTDIDDLFCVLKQKNLGIKGDFWQKKEVLNDFIEDSN